MRTRHFLFRQKILVRALGLTGFLCIAGSTQPVMATGVPVVDASHISTTMTSWFGEWGKTAKQWGKEGAQWKQTWDHYVQQLVVMKGLVMAVGLDKGVNLQPVDENTYMVAERCGSRFSVQELTKVFSLNSSGNIYEQQKQICGNIQRVQNIKYNLTVKFMKDNVPKMEDMVKEIATERNANNSNGTVDGVTSKSAQMNNELDLNFQNYQAQVASYDSYIASLENVQRVLAQGALKGKRGITGSFVKTAALKQALDK